MRGRCARAAARGAGWGGVDNEWQSTVVLDLVFWASRPTGAASIDDTSLETIPKDEARDIILTVFNYN